MIARFQPAVAVIMRDGRGLVGLERDGVALVLAGEVVVRGAGLQAVVEGVDDDGTEVPAVVVDAAGRREHP